MCIQSARSASVKSPIVNYIFTVANESVEAQEKEFLSN